MTTVAVAIGILLLWLRATLATPATSPGNPAHRHPGGLALLLTAATAAILTGAAVAGFRALASGALRSAAPKP